jgi:hypothetical protein
MSAPEGNTFSSKNNRLVADTLRRIAIQEDGKKLRAMCEAIYEKAANGDVSAAVFIADRLDGKPATVIAGDSENPIQSRLLVEFVKATGIV